VGYGLTRIAIPSGELTRRAFSAPLSAGALDRAVQPGGWVLTTQRVATVPGYASQGLTAVSTTASTLDGAHTLTFPGLDTFERSVSPDARYLWLHDRHNRVKIGRASCRESHGLYWSPDSQWAAFLDLPAEELADHPNPRELRLYAASVTGDDPLHNLVLGSWQGAAGKSAGGAGLLPLASRGLETTPTGLGRDSSPLLGWTADHALLLTYEGKRITRLDLDGRTTDILNITNSGRWGE